MEDVRGGRRNRKARYLAYTTRAKQALLAWRDGAGG